MRNHADCERSRTAIKCVTVVTLDKAGQHPMAKDEAVGFDATGTFIVRVEAGYIDLLVIK